MIERFLTYLRTELSLSPLTINAYRTDLRQWEHCMRSESPDGSFTPETYTTASLRSFLARMASEGCSTRTLQRKASALKTLYRFMLKEGVVKVNPAADLKAGRAPKTLPVFVRPEEMADMLDSDFDRNDYEQLRNRLIMVMLYSTGMRSAELIGLLDANVNTRTRELKVHGKRNKDRIIPFGQEMTSLINSYRTLRDSCLGHTGNPEFFLLSSGKPFYRGALYKIVNSTLKAEGVHASRMSPHVMRHSFATDMLNNGAELNAVSRLLGHASLASTQIYTHLTYRELKQNYLTAHPRAQKKGENHGSKN